MSPPSKERLAWSAVPSVSFNPTDQRDLIEALSKARAMVIRCSSAERVGSERYQRCHAVSAAIDLLAGALTGDPELFWVKAHGGSRGSDQ